MNEVKEIHKAEYGTDPEIIVTSPGRFHLIGEHSWFFKDKTLSMAVDIPVYVAVSRRNDSNIHFYFKQLDDRKKSSVSSLKVKKEDKWANNLKAVVFGFIESGYHLSGMDITVFSETLPSAGFGITTAVKAALALALRKLFDLKCNQLQVLMAIEYGNRVFLKIANHKADNYAALYSKKNNMILTDYTKNCYEYIPFDFPDYKILLVNAGVPRVSVWNEESLFEPENALLMGDLRELKDNIKHGGWQYIDNVTDINEELSIVSEDTKRKLYCILREHKDVLAAVSAIEKGDFSKFARHVNNSHISLRDYYDLSCPEIDWIIKRIVEIDPKIQFLTDPVSCGRITGKGFGRCIYAFLRNSDVDKFREKLTEYEHIFGFTTDCHEVSSADGAHVVEF